MYGVYQLGEVGGGGARHMKGDPSDQLGIFHGFMYHLSQNNYIIAPYFWTINFGRRNVKITSRKLF